ncbi:MAG: ABC transporter permease [Bdellovibrionota bacterium]
MDFFKIIVRNVLRHPLRSGLTAFGIAVALFAFCMIRTLIGAWYAGVEASAKNRLIVRNSVSLTFYLPLAYQHTIEQVPGVEKVGFGNWFGGIYQDERYRFQQFATDNSYIDIYSEFSFDPAEKQTWLTDRKGVLVGRDLAKNFNFKPGDVIQLKGTIFPGTWEFTISGIFDARDKEKDTRLMFFHWDYLNEVNKATVARQPDNVGFYVVQLTPGANPAEVSKAIDARFANSFAETLTETETAFVQGFVSMSSTIINVLNVVSCVVLVIMLLVLANTMLMSFRERLREYSILKALGFETPALSKLILGEAALLVCCGLVVLAIFLIPFFVLPTSVMLGALVNFFPVFRISGTTIGLVLGVGALTALVASISPLISLRRLRVSESLRSIG